MWAASSLDPRALQNVNGVGRLAAWSSATSFSIDLNLTGGHAYDISLYAVDWDSQGRIEQIQVTNAANGAVLNTEVLSNFSAGVYLDWRLAGNVVITVKSLAGPNAVVSGLFFDPTPTTAVPIKEDSATQGNWIGTYGTAGLRHPRRPLQSSLVCKHHDE